MILATFQAWNMLPPVMVEIITVTQKIAPSSQPSGASPGEIAAKPRLQTYIGPPRGLSGSLVSR